MISKQFFIPWLRDKDFASKWESALQLEVLQPSWWKIIQATVMAHMQSFLLYKMTHHVQV